MICICISETFLIANHEEVRKMGGLSMNPQNKAIVNLQGVSDNSILSSHLG
jgi:hypothetical protein